MAMEMNIDFYVNNYLQLIEDKQMSVALFSSIMKVYNNHEVLYNTVYTHNKFILSSARITLGLLPPSGSLIILLCSELIFIVLKSLF